MRNNFQEKINHVLNNLSDDEKEIIYNNIDSIIIQFKDIVQQTIRKTEDLNPLNVVQEFSMLPFGIQDKILKEVLFWTNSKIDRHREDFGYGIYAIVLRFIKDNCLVRDLKQAVKNININDKWIENIWKNCEHHVFTETMMDCIYNGKRITNEDLEFLLELCRSDSDINNISESIRAIATLREENYILHDDIFTEFLNHESPKIRASAIEAIWQTKNIYVMPHLEKLLETEKSQHVITTLNHVISILKKYQ